MGIKIEEISAKETHKLRHKVMWPDMPYAFVILENDNKGKHFGLFKEQEIISVISLFNDGYSAQFRKFATDTRFQVKGYGSILLKYLIADAKKENVIKKLWCNARINKVSFYEKFGLKSTNKTFIKEGVDYVVMEMNTTTIY